DREDWQQELCYRLLQRLPAFDPQRGDFRAFAASVIKRAVANILRALRAEKRRHQQTASLNVPVGAGDEGSIELTDTIDQPQQDPARGRRLRSAGERAQLGSDVRAVLARLPANLRRVAECLTRGTVSEIARELGVPRTTVSAWVCRLRPYFERAGLHDYLE